MIEVHRELEPGLLESTDEQCLTHELVLNEIGFKRQHPLPVFCLSKTCIRDTRKVDFC